MMLQDFLKTMFRSSAWMIGKITPYFTVHPEQTGETYLQHLRFTLMMGLRFLYIGAIIVVHGFLPFLFVRTASNQVIKTYRIMRTRVPKSQIAEAEAQEHQYHGA